MFWFKFIFGVNFKPAWLKSLLFKIKVQFIWSWVPETTLPGRVNLAFPCVAILKQPFMWMTRSCQLPQGGGGRQLGWTSFLTFSGRVTLAGGTTCLHINSLARPTGTTLGVASVTKCLGIKAEICITEVKITLQNPLRSIDRGNSTKVGHLHIWLINKGSEYSCRVNLDSACRETVFTYMYLNAR